MKTKKMRNTMVALISVALIAVGANAMAGKGMGDGENGRGYGGCGQHHRRGDCPYGQGQGVADLTAEQREQMETERQAFFDATRQDRQDLYAKRLALKAEIAKSEPDMKAASVIQKEVSTLQADLDQKRLEHIMAMRKINPDAGRGFFMEGRGQGRHGMRGGGGMGMGYGAGYCRE